MGLKNKLAKLIIDPSFRNPGIMSMIFAIDDATGIDLVKTLSPLKLMPASSELFQRSFAHFVAGEHISLACATELDKIVPDPVTARYLGIQAFEEQTHIDHFQNKLDQFGLGEARLAKYVAPGFASFGTAIQKRIAKGDYVGAMIGNNVVVGRARDLPARARVQGAPRELRRGLEVPGLRARGRTPSRAFRRGAVASTGTAAG